MPEIPQMMNIQKFLEWSAEVNCQQPKHTQTKLLIIGTVLLLFLSIVCSWTSIVELKASHQKAKM